MSQKEKSFLNQSFNYEPVWKIHNGYQCQRNLQFLVICVAQVFCFFYTLGTKVSASGSCDVESRSLLPALQSLHCGSPNSESKSCSSLTFSCGRVAVLGRFHHAETGGQLSATTLHSLTLQQEGWRWGGEDFHWGENEEAGFAAISEGMTKHDFTAASLS